MKWPDASASPVWRELTARAALLESVPLRDLFARDVFRSAWAVVGGADLTLDFSRQRLDSEVIALFAQLADDVGLRARILAMYEGAVLNPTENRAVLHTALRRSTAPHAQIVRSERERMLSFAESVRKGVARGATGAPFDRVINIGIGGSDLGPAMVVQALHKYSHPEVRVEFASNIDGCHLADVLERATPSRTLFIICSKTFTTLETRMNAEMARRWIEEQLGAAAVSAHFAAVSTNESAMDAFGVNPRFRFSMWDWVGGRFSLWSSIGVSIAIAIGAGNFEALLSGAAQMDEHFLAAPWNQNLPTLMACIGVWNIDHLRLPTLAVLPYDDRLRRFPAYLQQLEMESNGKTVRLDGSRTFCATAPVVWGEPGNNAQHSFFQMLHQGTPLAALDFLLPARSSCGDDHAHGLAIANALAQAEAFALGQAVDRIGGPSELRPHRVHPGGRPSSLIIFERLDPATLGRLIALYEHKVFVQSIFWGVNAFDQWGVELGKELAKDIVALLSNPDRADSPSLRATLKVLQGLRT